MFVLKSYNEEVDLCAKCGEILEFLNCLLEKKDIHFKMKICWHVLLCKF